MNSSLEASIPPPAIDSGLINSSHPRQLRHHCKIASMQFNVLTAGVSPEWLEEAASRGFDIGGRNEKAKIEASIKRLMEDLQQYKNTSFEGCFLRPDDEGELERFTTLLNTRKWDAITLGGGVRTIPWLGEFFTLLVNQVMRDQPQAKLLFPLLPEDIGPALKKHLPEAD